MTDTVTAKLAEWEALVEGATEGEWSWIHDTRVSGERVCRIGSLPGNHDVGWTPRGNGEADANFIAASRTAMPALLGFVEDVRAMHVSSSESRGVGRVDPETGEWGAYCDHDSEWWPCVTIQALTKWIGGEG